MTIILGIIGFMLFSGAIVIAACALSSYLSHRERQQAGDQTQRRLEEYVEREDESGNLWEEALAEMEQAEAKRWGK